jgi:hypothetical protein
VIVQQLEGLTLGDGRPLRDRKVVVGPGDGGDGDLPWPATDVRGLTEAITTSLDDQYGAING